MNTSERVQTLVFEKYEGLRNDFVVLDERNGTAAPSLPVQARVALCDRHAGVGADGVLTLLSPRVPDAIVRMHVTNADGSVPEMCGNGLRCVSRWLLDHDLIALDDPHFVDTDAGPLRCVVEESGVRVQMRGATTTGVCSDGPLVDEQIEVEGETFTATALSVGNPHFVLEGPAHRGLALRAGPVLEHHARFPARTNVEFVSVRSPTELDLFVWERGAGLT
ncbi:MAG: diaminopimelate epimerase, partial [Myxococcota bacterium]